MITDKASYDKAKAELKDKQWRKDNLQGSDSFTWHMGQHIALISAALLAYRRANHIYEIGDLVVTTKKSHLVNIDNIGTVSNINSLGYLFIDGSRSGYDPDNFRHATDAEIKANRRLD